MRPNEFTGTAHLSHLVLDDWNYLWANKEDGHMPHAQPSTHLNHFSVVLSLSSASSKKWQEKADLLTRLESQVKRMKENFDSKERLLLEERDKATESHKYAMIWGEGKSPQDSFICFCVR